MLNEKRLDLIQQIKDGLQDVHNSLLQESECTQGDHLCPSLTLGVLARMVHQHEHADPLHRSLRRVQCFCSFEFGKRVH